MITRYPCPVCLGATLQKVSVGARAPVEIDHCPRCGGVWLEHGEIPRLRQNRRAALWAAIARRRETPAIPCHGCHAPFDRDLEACPACGWRTVIDCPVCDRPMRRETVGPVHLDVCRSCMGAWFDHHELDAIWKEQTRRAAKRAGRRVGRADGNASDVLLAALWYAPRPDGVRGLRRRAGGLSA